MVQQGFAAASFSNPLPRHVQKGLRVCGSTRNPTDLSDLSDLSDLPDPTDRSDGWLGHTVTQSHRHVSFAASIPKVPGVP